jgi:hypothetical protein
VPRSWILMDRGFPSEEKNMKGTVMIKKTFLKIHSPITFHIENVSLLYVDYISCRVLS